jgi:uncharacterized membrane protein YoaK (UPF0700 family)
MPHAITAQTMPRPVPALLGFIAGFVDICAYFALFGIFVAQLTCSFVLAGARLVSGQQELMTLSAIPMFFVAGCVATALAVARAPAGRALSWVLGLECALLTVLLAVMFATAPVERESWAVVIAALIGIASMGVQSAAVRLFMKGAPSTNVMTTNTTQLAIDATIVLLALCGSGDAGQARESRARLGDYWPPMAGFILGTATGALCFKLWGLPALGVPIAMAYALLAWTLTLSPSPSSN